MTKLLSYKNSSPKKSGIEEDKNLKISLTTIDDEIQSLKAREIEIREGLRSTEVDELKRQLAGLEKSKNVETQFYKDQVAQLNDELLKLNENEQSQLSKTLIGKNRIMNNFQNRRNEIKSSMNSLKIALDEKIIKLERKINSVGITK